MLKSQERVQGGGAQWNCPPPPIEIESKKKVIRANCKPFHLYFATFFSRKSNFCLLFFELGPPPLEY